MRVLRPDAKRFPNDLLSGDDVGGVGTADVGGWRDDLGDFRLSVPADWLGGANAG